MHPFFDQLDTQKITNQNFDEKIITNNSEADRKIKIIFLWGENCPNCEMAKNVLTEYSKEIKLWPVTWFEANIYEDFDLAKRFGLHGIPVFLVYKNGQKIGKISPFPGWQPFSEAIIKVVAG